MQAILNEPDIASTFSARLSLMAAGVVLNLYLPAIQHGKPVNMAMLCSTV